MSAQSPVAVPLTKAYLLLNHGPVTLVSSAAGGRRNVMAAAWAMPLDFAPPKVAVVIDKSTLAVVDGSDLIQQVFAWNAATGSSDQTSSIVASSGTPSAVRPACLLPAMTLARTGLPVSTTWFGSPSRSKTGRAAGTEMHTRLAWALIILLARPGTEFCSWSR